jgi:hypothetical protein
VAEQGAFTPLAEAYSEIGILSEFGFSAGSTNAKKHPDLRPGVFEVGRGGCPDSAGVKLDDELLVDERVDVGAFWDA